MADRVILFVEGDTDEVVFDKIVNYYKRDYPKCKAIKCKIDNLKGVNKYPTKAKNKLLNNYLPDIRKSKDNLKCVICSYDTDIFEFSPNPSIDWPKLQNDMNQIVGDYGSVVQLLPVKLSIEDWLLADIEGLCKYLRLKSIPKRIKGSNGFEKLQSLFKKKDKLYTKGYDSENIIKHINIELIIKKYVNELKPLREALGVE